MSKWQPIETAPKNGSFIMLSGRYCDVPVFARWGVLPRSWIASTEHYEVNGNASIDDTVDDQIKAGYITHWMPLPDPPGAIP